MQLLKRGKQALKEGHGPAAKQAFSSALLNLDDVELELESPWRARRKALRGMGAACGCLGEHSQTTSGYTTTPADAGASRKGGKAKVVAELIF